MALNKQITLEGEATANIEGVAINTMVKKDLGQAYIKVVNITGNKAGIGFDVIYYFADVATINKSFNFVPALEGLNFIAQAYTHLKTLPEFADATDV
jgi:hypothetical protein